jgi:hypothetical protein
VTEEYIFFQSVNLVSHSDQWFNQSDGAWLVRLLSTSHSQVVPSGASHSVIREGVRVCMTNPNSVDDIIV